MHNMSVYSILFSRSIEGVLKKTFKFSLKNPTFAFFALRMIRWQKKAARRRFQWVKQGIHVPPLMMASITNRCNLTCKGCYAQALQRTSDGEMTIDQWHRIMNEARELGISIVMLLGGEPFVRQDILQVTKCFPEMIFLVFTNGLLLNREIMNELKLQKNVVPMISMEGFEKDTDKRRGKGVHGKIQRTMEGIKAGGTLFGASLTVTRDNFTVVTSDHYIQDLIDTGCKLIFFEEYIPVAQGSENLALDGMQREKLESIKNALSEKFNALFIIFPGSERKYGGCLAAGRGLIHINFDGNLEPCPLIPYSDTNVINASLKEALKSQFLMTIRNNGKTLNDNSAVCPLRGQQEWINSYFANNKMNQKMKSSGSAFL